MPVAIRSPFAPLTAALSSYIASHKARAEAQRSANGTTSGPTGAEVDAHVASTLNRKYGARVLAELPLDGAGAAQVDYQGRTLGLEDPNDPALRPDPTTAVRANAQPKIVPVTTVTDPDLIAKVTEATNAKQTSIPLFPTPTETVEGDVDVNQYGFIDPRVYGGTSFDLVGDGLHEPLNVIVSSLSSPAVLTRKGLQSYCRSLDFDRECLGLHAGGYQKAYIDARGWRDQEFIYRQVYTPLDHVFGTCLESLVGGNHFRAWQQQASGAWFLATSKEQTASKNHMIVPDGYNLGRNELVKQALGKTKDGKTSFMLTKYRTDVQFVAGLMPQGVQGVNHDIAVDGLTAVLTVTVLPETGWFRKADTSERGQRNQNQVGMGMSAAAASEHELTIEHGAEQETRKQEEHQVKPRPRRVSLAKRFSLSRDVDRHQSVNQQASTPYVWQKLRRMSAPKLPNSSIHPSALASVEATDAAATTQGQGTTATAATESTQPQPGGHVTAAPPSNA